MENLLILGSWFEVLPKLTDEQAGKLFKGFGKWLKGEEVLFEDAILQGFWFGIEGNLNNMEKKYQSKVDSNRENGKKGGRPKKNTETENNPNNPNGFSETQITHDNPKNLKDKDKEKDKDKDKEKEMYMETNFIRVEEETEETLTLKELYSQYNLKGQLTEEDRLLYYELFNFLKSEKYYVTKYSIEEYGIV